MKNFESIQLLRFIAAFLVVIHHAVYVGGQLAPVHPTAVYLAGFGAVGVHVFFVVSGFVMVHATFARERTMSWQDFLYRRFVRIYPIYWVYAATILAATYLVTGESLSVGDAALSFLLAPGYSSLIIIQGWTLSYEVYFYVMFAAIIWLGALRGLIALTLFFLASIAVGIVIRKEFEWMHVVTNSLLLEFLMGAWISAGLLLGFRFSRLNAWALICLSVSLYGTGLWIDYTKAPSVLSWGIPSALLVAGLTMLEADRALPSGVARMSWLGDSSYSLYLLHLFTLKALAALLAASLIAFYAVAPAVCCGIAILAYKYIEGPMIGRLRLRDVVSTRRQDG